jgi:RND family efflux transporter MFP subunit
MKYIILIAVLAATVACHKHSAVIEKTVTPVRVAAVDLYQPKGGTRYSASILPGRQAGLAFRVSGFVTDIRRLGNRGLEPGDIVSAGTVLARLRAEDYRISATQAQSQLEAARESQRNAAGQLAQAQASRVKAEQDFIRAKTLMESKSLTRPEFDSAKAQFDVASAQVESAQAQLDGAAAQIRNAEASMAAARLAQNDTALVAPFTASVVQRNVEVGMLAGPSQMAYSLADISMVKAAFGVPDTVVVQLRSGRPIDVTVEALPGHEFRGAVSAIASVADTETRLFQVEVAIPNREMHLKPGMIASLALHSGAPPQAVPVVPLSAVVRDRTSPAEFAVMVVEGKVAKARRVGLGSTFGELLAVTSGLKAGELVIRAGGTLVNDGEAVEVIP